MPARRTRNPHIALRLVPFATLAAVLVALAALPSMGAAQQQKAQTVGTNGLRAGPSCPTPPGADPAGRRGCRVMSRVTAFQIRSRGERQPHRVPRTGTIVAWAIDLSRPSRDERRSFSEGFEFGEPSARLAVLQRKKRGRVTLTRQTPRIDLRPHLGSVAIFTLDEPIRVQRGRTLGLTTQSWSPNLAHGMAAGPNRWRASRNPGNDNRCSNRDFLIEESRAHTKVRSTRRYSCEYRGENVLYWAFIVPDRQGGN